MLVTIKRDQNSTIKKTIDLDAFERFYVELLLNLKEGYSLPQNIIQGITFGFRSLIELIHELLKSQIKSSLIQCQRTTKYPSTENVFALEDINKVIWGVGVMVHRLLNSTHTHTLLLPFIIFNASCLMLCFSTNKECW